MQQRRAFTRIVVVQRIILVANVGRSDFIL